MERLAASVGKGGKNLQQDVALVQDLLKSRGCDPGPCDGVCGDNTVAAIRKFQLTFMPHPDGLIEPGKDTWVRLAGADADVTPGPEGGEDWSGESSQWSQEKKLKSMHPKLREKVIHLLAALQRRDFKPQIYYGWRSVKVQLDLYEQGYTKVKFSFHNAQKPDGTPNAHAADIVDCRYGWSEKAERSGFWKALGEEAKKQGLIWGGDWASFPDLAHVQLLPNEQLQKVKQQSGL